jgi:hypothetical protein
VELWHLGWKAKAGFAHICTHKRDLTARKNPKPSIIAHISGHSFTLASQPQHRHCFPGQHKAQRQGIMAKADLKRTAHSTSRRDPDKGDYICWLKWAAQSNIQCVSHILTVTVPTTYSASFLLSSFNTSIPFLLHFSFFPLHFLGFVSLRNETRCHLRRMSGDLRNVKLSM